jgi:hypothetical protein
MSRGYFTRFFSINQRLLVLITIPRNWIKFYRKFVELFVFINDSVDSFHSECFILETDVYSWPATLPKKCVASACEHAGHSWAMKRRGRSGWTPLGARTGVHQTVPGGDMFTYVYCSVSLEHVAGDIGHLSTCMSSMIKYWSCVIVRKRIVIKVRNNPLDDCKCLQLF